MDVIAATPGGERGRGGDASELRNPSGKPADGVIGRSIRGTDGVDDVVGIFRPCACREHRRQVRFCGFPPAHISYTMLCGAPSAQALALYQAHA